MIWWTLALFLAGMVLIIVEFLLPGGILGGIGAVLLVISTVVGVRAFPEAALFIIIGEMVGAVVCIVIGLFLLTKTKAGKAIALDQSQRIEDGYVNLPSEEGLIGMTGVVLAALRPAGTITVGERRIDAVSDGVFIEKGAPVRILEVHGNRVVVEREEPGGTDAA